MPKKQLEGLIAVTEHNLEIEKVKAKAKAREAEVKLTEAKVKHDKQIEKRWMTIIKWALWPALAVFAFLYLR